MISYSRDRLFLDPLLLYVPYSRILSLTVNLFEYRCAHNSVADLDLAFQLPNYHDITFVRLIFPTIKLYRSHKHFILCLFSTYIFLSLYSCKTYHCFINVCRLFIRKENVVQKMYCFCI